MTIRLQRERMGRGATAARLNRQAPILAAVRRRLPSLLGFKHVGVEVRLLGGGDIAVKRGTFDDVREGAAFGDMVDKVKGAAPLHPVPRSPYSPAAGVRRAPPSPVHCHCPPPQVEQPATFRAPLHYLCKRSVRSSLGVCSPVVRCWGCPSPPWTPREVLSHT